MSVETDLCDNILDELVSTVPGLANVSLHRYVPFSVENLIADGGKHLAVWVAPEEQGQEQTFALATMTSIVRFSLVISYWEPSDEADNLLVDERRAAELMGMKDDCRARLMDESIRSKPPAYRMDWVAAASGLGGAQNSGLVSWWAAEIYAWVPFTHST